MGIWEDGSEEGRAVGGDGVPSGGSSAGWVATLSNQQNVGDMFLAYIKEASPELGGKWGAEWSEVPENYAASQELFAHFATYLVNVYVYGSQSKHLEIPSALAIWSGLLQQNKKRLGKSSVQATKVRACPPAKMRAATALGCARHRS